MFDDLTLKIKEALTASDQESEEIDPVTELRNRRWLDEVAKPFITDNINMVVGQVWERIERAAEYGRVKNRALPTGGGVPGEYAEHRDDTIDSESPSGRKAAPMPNDSYSRVESDAKMETLGAKMELSMERTVSAMEGRIGAKLDGLNTAQTAKLDVISKQQTTLDTHMWWVKTLLSGIVYSLIAAGLLWVYSVASRPPAKVGTNMESPTAQSAVKAPRT